MMMLQNAQMHQLFMQQLLAQGLRPKDDQQTVVIEQPPLPQPPQPQFITVGVETNKNTGVLGITTDLLMNLQYILF